VKGLGVQPQPLLSANRDVGSGTRELVKLSADKACVVIGVLGGYAMEYEAPGNEVVMVVITVVVVVRTLLS